MKIIREKISKEELIESCEFIFNKFNYDEDYYTIKETLTIGKRDYERFVAICHYHLTSDPERFKRIFKPVLEEMLINYGLKKTFHVKEK